MYGWSEAEALERNIRELIPEWLKENELKRVQQWKLDRLAPAVERELIEAEHRRQCKPLS